LPFLLLKAPEIFPASTFPYSAIKISESRIILKKTNDFNSVSLAIDLLRIDSGYRSRLSSFENAFPQH
jgi:hypothetical protein